MGRLGFGPARSLGALEGNVVREDSMAALVAPWIQSVQTPFRPICQTFYGRLNVECAELTERGHFGDSQIARTMPGVSPGQCMDSRPFLRMILG
jgi:hypothetical protein